MGKGPFGYIFDAYRLQCRGAGSVTVYLDVYHRHVERSAVPGFSMADMVSGANR